MTKKVAPEVMTTRSQDVSTAIAEDDATTRSATDEAVARRVPNPDPPTDRRTLEDELGTADFAERGWFKLADLADYLAHFVDGRTTGLLATRDPKVFYRVAGLASLVKAAAQWFALDDGPTPAFVTEAEKYLATKPHGLPFPVPLVIDLPQWNLRTGPVIRRKGGRGPTGRLHELSELKAHFVALLAPLNDLDREAHVRAYQDPKSPRPKQRWVLPHAFAGEMFSAFAHGKLSDLLREHDVRWHSDAQFSRVADALAKLFEYEVRFEPAAGVDRAAHLGGIAEQVIMTTLEALGIPMPKDFFRNRRGAGTSTVG